jgi:hypothetical protein
MLISSISIYQNVEAADSETILNEDIKLTATDSEIQNGFGSAVAIDGDYAIIGALWDDTNGEDSGSAYIFKNQGGNWIQQQKLVPGEIEAYDMFGVSVEIQGDYAIIGAKEDYSYTHNQNGAVYIYKRNGETWDKQQIITASDGAMSDAFGYTLSIYDDTLIVGAPYDDDNGENTGSVYVFKLIDESWIQDTKLTASDAKNYDFFGSSISLYQDTVVIGAISSSYFHIDKIGSAYIFKRNDESWTQEAILRASDENTYNEFGNEVSIYDDIAVINSKSYSYVFEYENSLWIQKEKLDISFEKGTVDTQKDTIIIGASQLGFYHNSNKTHIYKRINDSWIKTAVFELSNDVYDDYFGMSIASDEDTVIIGASGSGRRYLFCKEVIGSSYLFTIDSDGDGNGDSTDEDDDNDGFTDIQEDQAGTNMYDSSDFPTAEIPADDPTEEPNNNEESDEDNDELQTSKNTPGFELITMLFVFMVSFIFIRRKNK